MNQGNAGRFRATIQYDGSRYHGWQVQPDVPTVQGEIEDTLADLAGGPVRVHASGRTDRGVHAVGQEIAFDAPSGWTEGEMGRALGATLPDAVHVERFRRADPDFHPRFDARRRRYEYFVGVTREARSPLRRRHIWPLGRAVDLDRLRRAARPVSGARSFRAFAKSGQPERGTRCRIDRAEWERTLLGDLRFRVVADRFLHHMVRYLVKTMIEEATGRREEGEVRDLLEGNGEASPPGPAPPQGLYLTGVRYDDGWNRPPGVPGLVPAADGSP